MRIPIIKVSPTPAAVVDMVAQKIVELATQANRAGDMFSLFLSGGSSPRALYEVISSDAYRSHIQWSGVQLFFGDERCVPPDDERSNYKMAFDSLISRVPIPRDNVYRMKGELDPQEAAKQYGLELKQIFRDQGPDLILLGMGDDGHTASLFPGTDALGETEHRCVANYVPHDYIPAGTSWRITLTFPFINRSTHVAILATGAGKAERISEVIEGPLDADRLPIQRVDPAGTLAWYMDTAAAGM